MSFFASPIPLYHFTSPSFSCSMFLFPIMHHYRHSFFFFSIRMPFLASSIFLYRCTSPSFSFNMTPVPVTPSVSSFFLSSFSSFHSRFASPFPSLASSSPSFSFSMTPVPVTPQHRHSFSLLSIRFSHVSPPPVPSFASSSPSFSFNMTFFPAIIQHRQSSLTVSLFLFLQFTFLPPSLPGIASSLCVQDALLPSISLQHYVLFRLPSFIKASSLPIFSFKMLPSLLFMGSIILLPPFHLPLVSSLSVFHLKIPPFLLDLGSIT